MNTSYLHIHYKTQVLLLITECRVWYIPYLEINGWWSNRLLFTPNNTTSILHQYCICTCVTMRIIEKCNRPKLFMITGRNGLYFLLRLGRLSYAIGFQSEQCNLSKYAISFGVGPRIRVHWPLHFLWWPPVFANGPSFLSISLIF